MLSWVMSTLPPFAQFAARLAEPSDLRRAITAAERRLDFNKQRASDLRGQTYYKPEGNPEIGRAHV
mgnify:CR=1 FL=1